MDFKTHPEIWKFLHTYTVAEQTLFRYICTPLKAIFICDMIAVYEIMNYLNQFKSEKRGVLIPVKDPLNVRGRRALIILGLVMKWYNT